MLFRSRNDHQEHQPDAQHPTERMAGSGGRGGVHGSDAHLRLDNQLDVSGGEEGSHGLDLLRRTP